MKRWKKISWKYILRTPWLSLRKDTYKTPIGGIINDFYIVERPDFIVIVPQSKDGKYILVKQYRHGLGRSVLNFPMGFVEKNETLQETAKRELAEETKYFSGNLEYIGRLYLSPPFIKCKGHIFLARDISIIEKDKKIDDTEIEKIIFVDQYEIEELINKKALSDFVSVASYYLVKNKGRHK